MPKQPLLRPQTEAPPEPDPFPQARSALVELDRHLATRKPEVVVTPEPAGPKRRITAAGRAGIGRELARIQERARRPSDSERARQAAVSKAFRLLANPRRRRPSGYVKRRSYALRRQHATAWP